MRCKYCGKNNSIMGEISGLKKGKDYVLPIKYNDECIIIKESIETLDLIKKNVNGEL